jgi:hypothetical protein
MLTQNWQKIRDEYEKDMVKKFAGLPGHKKVSSELQEFRNIISHELPEITPVADFKKLIEMLKNGDNNLVFTRKILKENLKVEALILNENQDLIDELKLSAINWVKQNLPEEKLQQLWKNHKTWLPRRYTIYKDPNTPFEIIATDTLVRFYIFHKR